MLLACNYKYRLVVAMSKCPGRAGPTCLNCARRVGPNDPPGAPGILPAWSVGAECSNYVDDSAEARSVTIAGLNQATEDKIAGYLLRGYCVTSVMMTHQYGSQIVIDRYGDLSHIAPD